MKLTDMFSKICQNGTKFWSKHRQFSVKIWFIIGENWVQFWSKIGQFSVTIWSIFSQNLVISNKIGQFLVKISVKNRWKIGKSEMAGVCIIQHLINLIQFITWLINKWRGILWDSFYSRHLPWPWSRRCQMRNFNFQQFVSGAKFSQRTHSQLTGLVTWPQSTSQPKSQKTNKQTTNATKHKLREMRILGGDGGDAGDATGMLARWRRMRK